MGSAQSSPTPQPLPCQQRYTNTTSRSSRQEREDSIDEKFDAVRIYSPSKSTCNGRVLDNRSSHVSAADTEAYITQLLQEPKNRLAYSALSTSNPSTVLEKPSAVLRDQQHFNVAIPYEGSPVTNQRSSGRCWIFAACNVFRIGRLEEHKIPRARV